MSPCMASLGFQPPLFPVQENKVAVTSVHDHLSRARRVWLEARKALVRSAACNQWLADHHRLSSRDLPLLTERVESSLPGSLVLLRLRVSLFLMFNSRINDTLTFKRTSL